MKIQGNVLLLFSKYPEPGMVKTRLTVDRGGMFTEEDAASLYKAMLLDVCSLCLAAFERIDGECTLVVSTAPAADLARMRGLLLGEFGEGAPIEVISDAGASFDEHYNDAFAQCWTAGADRILSMGADMPALTVDDVVRGFSALQGLAAKGECGIALSPDQEMGVSLIGWNRDTDFDHTGVFYNATGLTVLPAYIDKAREADIAAIYLPPVPDVDTMADLMHNITLVNALDYCCRFDGGVPPRRTLAMLEWLGCDEVRIPPNDLRDPREAIDG